MNYSASSGWTTLGPLFICLPHTLKDQKVIKDIIEVLHVTSVSASNACPEDHVTHAFRADVEHWLLQLLNTPASHALMIACWKFMC